MATFHFRVDLSDIALSIDVDNAVDSDFTDDVCEKIAEVADYGGIDLTSFISRLSQAIGNEVEINDGPFVEAEFVESED